MRKRAALLAVAVLVLVTALYAEKDMKNVSTSQTAAKAKIDVGSDRNGNSDVYIRTWHMARQKDGRAFYVVWFQPEDGGAPQNAGVIEIDDDAKGAFRTLTPLRDFEVFITVETDRAATAPTGEELFRTEIDR